MKVVTVPEMLKIEREADASGLTYTKMMANAGHNLAEVVAQTYSHLKEGGVVGLVGKGNNGGDTLVALLHLVNQGWRASAYMVHYRPQDYPLIQQFQKAGGKILEIEEEADYQQLTASLASNAVLLDGILGTGIKLPLRGSVVDVLGTVKRHLIELECPPIVVAVDCPSGVDCDTGEAAPETLSADLTVTMAAVKAGLYNFPASDHVGELQVVGIGLPKDLPSLQAITRIVVDEETVRKTLLLRPRNAHKGTFGTVMVVAGSVNYTGAALLAGKAAFRVGAGLVTLAVPSVLHTALAGHFPEATWLLLPDELGVISVNAAGLLRGNLKRTTAVVIGPGFGLENTTRDFVSHLLTPVSYATPSSIGFVKPKEEDAETQESDLPPLVVDADGLKLLAKVPDWAAKLPSPAVLTPHPGEMAILTGLEKDEIQADRLGTAERFAREWGHVVVLKGAFTVVAAPDGHTALIPVASAALARAGTGDVLAGMIAGQRAQGLEAFEAAMAGAWLHAQSGLQAQASLGNSAAVLARDVLEAVVDVLRKFQEN